MTKLRNIVGIALVAMSMLTGLAVTSAPAQEQYGKQLETEICEYSPDGSLYCYAR
jgi:hypothetical protein